MRLKLAMVLIVVVVVMNVSARPPNAERRPAKGSKAPGAGTSPPGTAIKAPGTEKRDRHHRHRQLEQRRNKKQRRPGPHQRRLKEFDYSSDTDDVSKNLSSVKRLSKRTQKTVNNSRNSNSSNNNKKRLSSNNRSKRQRQSKHQKPTPSPLSSLSSKPMSSKNGGRNKKSSAAAKGRRWTRRSDVDVDVNDDSSLLGLGKPTIRPNQLTPFVNVGVFGDMRKFFDELRTNIPDFTNDQLESALMDKFNQERITPSEGEESEIEEEFPSYQALRSDLSLGPGSETERRQSRLRGFVSMAEPLRKSRHNQYDPALLWTGLG